MSAQPEIRLRPVPPPVDPRPRQTYITVRGLSKRFGASVLYENFDLDLPQGRATSGSLVIPPNGFPHWNLERSSPPVLRQGAVMPSFVNLALARQKKMIPKVDMLRNRIVSTYAPLTAVEFAAAAA